MGKEKLLILDIGNRFIKVYVTVGDELGGRWQFSRADLAWSGRLSTIARQSGAEAAIVVSVVPETTEVALNVLAGEGLGVVNVNGEMELPIKLEYGNLRKLGADRVAVAVGAWNFYSDDAKKILVVDAGTAVTIDLISNGVFRGGAILPGIELMKRALFQSTAQLGPADDEIKPQFPGKGTGQCIAAGTVAAVCGAVIYLWERLVKSDINSLLLLTGGSAGFISSFLPLPHRIDDLLLVKGAIAIYDFAKAREKR